MHIFTILLMQVGLISLFTMTLAENNQPMFNLPDILRPSGVVTCYLWHLIAVCSKENSVQFHCMPSQIFPIKTHNSHPVSSLKNLFEYHLLVAIQLCNQATYREETNKKGRVVKIKLSKNVTHSTHLQTQNPWNVPGNAFWVVCPRRIPAAH